MNFFMRTWRRFSLNRALKKMTKCLESGALDIFLETLLKVMSLVLLIDKKYRRNISGFNARYSFHSRDKKIAASVVFKKNKMKSGSSVIGDTNVAVVFKDGQALKDFLFNDNPDIIASILESKVSYTGNLNYLAKFAFMAKSLQLKYSF